MSCCTASIRYQNYQLSEFSFLTYRCKQPYLKIAVEKFKRLKSILIWILNEYNTNETDYEKSLRSLLNLLLIDLNRLFEPIPKNTEFSQSLQLVHHFEELINQHYKQKHFVKEYAAMLNIRPNYLNSVCNDVVKITTGDLIRNRILLESKRLLIHEQKAVAEIAYELGFEDNSYFGRFFKKYENITPDAFKRTFINTSKSSQI